MACQKPKSNGSVPSVVVLRAAIPDAEGFYAVRNAFNAVPVLNALAEDVAIWGLYRCIWHCFTFASAVIASNDAADRAKPNACFSHSSNDVILDVSHVVAVARTNNLIKFELAGLKD